MRVSIAAASINCARLGTRRGVHIHGLIMAYSVHSAHTTGPGSECVAEPHDSRPNASHVCLHWAAAGLGRERLSPLVRRFAPDKVKKKSQPKLPRMREKPSPRLQSRAPARPLCPRPPPCIPPALTLTCPTCTRTPTKAHLKSLSNLLTAPDPAPARPADPRPKTGIQLPAEADAV